MESPGPAHATIARAGPGCIPEPSIQGYIPSDDRGFLEHGYRCNLELINSYTEDGFMVSFAWYDQCVYADTAYLVTDPDYDELKGVRVIDASDPGKLARTALLQTPAMALPLESMKVNERRGLLGAVQAAIRTEFLPGGPFMDLYGLEDDPAHPELLASVELFPGSTPHIGQFSPDGSIFYAMGSPLDCSLVAIDISDPRKPKRFFDWTEDNLRASGTMVDPHEMYFGPGDDGDIAYLPQKGNNGPPSGLVIADVSEVRARRSNARVHIVGEVSWDDGTIAQAAPVGRIGDRLYAFVTDEFGCYYLAPADACEHGRPPFGFIHVVDVTDPTNPVQVSTIRLETNDPANVGHTGGETTFFGLAWSSHYCSLDDPENTTALACAWQQSGVRVFDVRDPLHPREIAYYNPPPKPEIGRGNATIKPVLYPSSERDSTLSVPRWYRRDDGSTELWIMSCQNGFQMLRFTNGAYPLASGQAP